jgi:hypothetical protein
MLHAKEKPFVASHSTPALSGHQRNLTMKWSAPAKAVRIGIISVHRSLEISHKFSLISDMSPC